MIDYKLFMWTVFLCCGVLYWLYTDSDMSIDYVRHERLVDPVTKIKKTPREAFNLTKIIKYSDSYINSTNAQQRLYDLQYNLESENPFTIDQTYSDEQALQISGWPVANQDKCGRQLDWIVTQLMDDKNYLELKGRLGYELTNLMDSFGRPESGLYSGAINWLGSYEICKKTTLDEARIRTRYCLVRMRPYWWPKEDSQTRSSIRIGVCIPETCDTLSFDRYKQTLETLIKFQLPEAYKKILYAKSMFCLPDERSPIRSVPLSGHIYLYILSGWLSLVIMATIVHEVNLRRSKSQHVAITNVEKESMVMMNPVATIKPNFSNNILRVLSLRNSLKGLKSNSFRVKYHQGQRVRVDLGGLDFIKIMMALVVILGHSAYIGSIYSRSLGFRVNLNLHALANMAQSVARCVDTFFVFFGLLTSYTLMRKFNTRQLSNPLVWLGVNLGVIVRITPIFMLVFWYSKSISPYTGSGPWWDYGVDKDSMKSTCLASPWWRSIPYFGSHGQPSVPTCVLPGWFIVSYSQISILLPIITYILIKLPSHFWRLILVLFLTIISCVQIAIKLTKQTSIPVEGFSLYGAFLTNLPEKFQASGYLTTLSRLGGVSIGCYVGYLLRIYETDTTKQWPQWLKSNLTILLSVIALLIMIFLPVIGLMITNLTGSVASLQDLILVNSVMIILWPILIAIIIINGATVNNHKVVVRFLSHSFWHAFNKLGLCIYLVHWEILFVGYTSFEYGPSYGFVTDIMKMWAFGTFFSIILAFVVYILIEAPLTGLLMLAARLFMVRQDKPSDGRIIPEVRVKDSMSEKNNN